MTEPFGKRSDARIVPPRKKAGEAQIIANSKYKVVASLLK